MVTVSWADRKQVIELKIQIEDASNVQVEIKPQFFSLAATTKAARVLRATPKKQRLHTVEIAQLFSVVDPERSSYQIKGRFIFVELWKGTKREVWPKLTRYPASGTTFQKDWERFEEYDEESDEDEDEDEKEYTHDDGEEKRENAVGQEFKKKSAATRKAETESAASQDVSPTTPNKRATNSALKTFYLTVYNLVLLSGWLYVLLRIETDAVVALVKAPSHQSLSQSFLSFTGSVYDSVGLTVLLLQAFASLEVVHAVLQVVPGSWLSALLLHMGRDIILFGIVANFRVCQTDWALFGLCFVFALGEIIRYPFYLLTTLGKEVPFPLLWLRYTASIALLPFGYYCEIRLALLTLPLVKNTMVFGLVNGASAVLGYLFIAYVLGGPYIILTVYRQRQKKLHPNSKAKAVITKEKTQ